MSEKRQRFPGFIGPSYQSRSGRFDNERTVNLYLETNELGGGKGGEPAVLLSTPGLKLLQTVGAGPIRACYTLSNQSVLYVVSGSEIYQLSGSLATPILISGTLGSRTGPVSIMDNGIQVVFVDGTNGYYITIGETTLHQIDDPHFHPADLVSYQDGYFIFNWTGTQYFFISDLYAITFPDSNTAAKAGNSDILIAAVSNSRELYLLGAHSTEIWWNSGASGVTPFARQDGKFSQIGCVAAHSIVTLGETLFFLGSNSQGGGVVYQLENGMPTRVSTHAVEYAIQKLGDLSGATAYSYQQEGHHFYCLNIPGSRVTWCYDPEIKQWHERQSTVKGVTSRHLGQAHCVINGTHLVGDYRNGNLYKYDLDCFTDNDELRIRARQTPHISSTLNRMFYSLFELDAEFGVGRTADGVAPSSDVTPRLVLEMSQDGGATFSNPMYGVLGKIGEYRTRARWHRLGSSRDVIFKVSCTDNVKVTFLSAHLGVEVGTQ